MALGDAVVRDLTVSDGGCRDINLFGVTRACGHRVLDNRRCPFVGDECRRPVLVCGSSDDGEHRRRQRSREFS